MKKESLFTGRLLSALLALLLCFGIMAGISTMSASATENEGYKIKIHIKVTDDADWWDYAYFNIYAKSDNGMGKEKLVKTSGDFHKSIDDDDEEYTYEYNCGDNNFPSAVNVKTSFGSWGTWRDFEADVKIYINGVNSGSRHIVHKVYGDEEKNTKIKIGGDKYPYPEEFEIDIPEKINPLDKTSGIITVKATDQYGNEWESNAENVKMQNVSFPEDDTFEAVDESGTKWRLTSTYTENHISTYELIYTCGSNVYPEVKKEITANFKFPFRKLKVIVSGKEVLNTKGLTGDTVSLADIKPPVGYYINGYSKEGFGTYDKSTNKFTFGEDSATLTAKLKSITYKIEFDKNAEDATNKMKLQSAIYDRTLTFDRNRFEREGYEFVGWNTQSDGMGKMYEDEAKFSNLTTVKGAKVTLYAIWKPVGASTTASIFSYNTIIIYIGAAVLLIAVAAAVFYSVRKKRAGKNSSKS